ncbi:MAG: lysozyme [Pseudomonadota bacterium]
MQTTFAAISLIKDFEGFRHDAYFDPVGIPTIGFGTTKYKDGRAVQFGDTITPEIAEEELFFHVREEVEPVLEAQFGGLPLAPNQRDALASFVYNLGGDRDKYPTLYAMIHEGADQEAVAQQLLRYRNAGGKPLLGLYRRRMAEALMWMGLPWERAKTVEFDDDVLQIAAGVRYAEGLAAPKPAPDPEIFDTPPPSPKPEPIKVEPPPEVRPAPVGTKPPSPNTKAADDLPYKVDPKAGAKPMEESERFWGTMLEAVGHFGRTWSTRAVGAAGASAAFFGDLLKSPAVIAILAACIAWLIFFATTQLGRHKKRRGEEAATQVLY